VHGNGIPDGNGNPVGFPWEWDEKSQSHGSGNGSGNYVDGNGNDPHSHSYGNPIPMDKWKENRAVCQNSTLSLVESCIHCIQFSSAAFSAQMAGCWKNDELESTNSLLFLHSLAICINDL